jgi:hypothetical protein
MDRLDEHHNSAHLFDFITDDDFRSGLESDYCELIASLKSNSWKAAHVLSGSIIEAVLADYLLAIGYTDPSGKDILEMQLGQIISACLVKGIITKRCMDLSTVVKDFRNLIHPGRVLRLQQPVDNNGANVAHALVKMIIEEITNTKRKTYGWTAEQIVDKLDRDPSSLGILQHLLRETKEIEQKRLLLKILPDVYFQVWSPQADDDPEDGRAAWLQRIENCYRAIFTSVSDEIKRAAMITYVAVLKESNHHRILVYDRAFVRGTDLVYCSTRDADLIKDHLITQSADDDHLATIRKALGGIGRFLTVAEFTRLATSLIDTILPHNPAALAYKVAMETLITETDWSPASHIEEVQKVVAAKIAYVRAHQTKFPATVLGSLDHLSSQVNRIIPF